MQIQNQAINMCSQYRMQSAYNSDLNFNGIKIPGIKRTKPENNIKSTISNLLKHIKNLKTLLFNGINNLKSMGLGIINTINLVRKHGKDILPDISQKITSINEIGKSTLKSRHTNKNINVTLSKIMLEPKTSRYVMKHNGAYCGSIDIRKLKDNEICIDYMTNIGKRDSIRNIETTLIQTVAEDYLHQNGKLPTIKCFPAPMADNMNRMYNNEALYKRMGMKETEQGIYVINSSTLEQLMKTKLSKTEEIISGTKNMLGLGK